MCTFTQHAPHMYTLHTLLPSPSLAFCPPVSGTFHMEGPGTHTCYMGWMSESVSGLPCPAPPHDPSKQKMSCSACLGDYTGATGTLLRGSTPCCCCSVACADGGQRATLCLVAAGGPALPRTPLRPAPCPFPAARRVQAERTGSSGGWGGPGGRAWSWHGRVPA